MFNDDFNYDKTARFVLSTPSEHNEIKENTGGDECTWL